jgi:hypothetical protein
MHRFTICGCDPERDFNVFFRVLGFQTLTHELFSLEYNLGKEMGGMRARGTTGWCLVGMLVLALP